MYLNIKHFIAWLPLVGALGACSVDLNEEPYGEEGGPAAECAAADRSRIRILQAARTGTLAPPAKPTVPQTVALNRPDPQDTAKLLAFANLRFNGTTSTTLCPGVTKVTITSQTVNGDKIEPIELDQIDLEIAAAKRYLVVVTGNIAPAEGQDGIQLIVVDESAIPEDADGGGSNVVLVNAIVDSPTLSVSTDGEDGPEVVELPRYGVSELVPVAPDEASITLLDGEEVAASFTIAGFPSGKNLIAVLYDKFAPAMNSTRTQAKLFLTGSDALIGNAPGNGIKIAAD